MYFDCIMAGHGGQGILSAGMILAQMAFHSDLHVTWFPSYGAEQRGGTANCAVVISNEEIGSPIISNPLYGLIMNYPSLVKFQPKFKKNAKAVVDLSLVSKEYLTREDITFYGVDATKTASELGSAKVSNMVMIGALLKISGLFDINVAKEMLKLALSKRHHNLLPVNKEALQKGYEFVSEV